MKEPPYTPPSSEQAKKHWQRQDVSVQRTPGLRDPGLTVIPDKDALQGLIASEVSGVPQVAYRMRNPVDEPVEDAVARSQRMIRLALTMERADFYSRCENSEDVSLYFIMYGDMKDAQRAHALQKYTDHIHRKQQDSYKEHHAKERAAQRDSQNQLAAYKLLNSLASKSVKKEPDEL